MTSALKIRIDDVISQIADARQQVANNLHVDLSGLEDDIEIICIAARREAQQGDNSFRAVLETMLTDLDALEKELTQQRDMMGAPQGRTVAPNVAASAYGKAKR